ncbi:PAS domain-containing sensor histidine kinase [Pedobacter psychrodurus]|nr:ATP-binding protein [Pedobacter psychrodurus]
MRNENLTQGAFSFVNGSSEMASLIRMKNWSGSPLGALESWPEMLKSMIATVLASPFPMHICWGKQLFLFYNDAYRPILGSTKHPVAMGNPIGDSFPEVWEQVGPLYQTVLEGQSVRHSDRELILNRNGSPETCYFDFSYSPIIGRGGQVLGVMTYVVETSVRKFAEIEKLKLSKSVYAINEELTTSNEELVQANEELMAVQEHLKQTINQLEESDTSLRLAVEAADFGIWHIHSLSRDFITTPRLRELFGLGHFEKIIIEQAITQIREDFRDYVSTTLENAIYNNGEYDVTYPVIGLNDNKLRWLRAIGRLRADPSGEFSDFTGVVMDVSDIKKDEERKNDFIGMVSHELKTPLTSISAYLQFLEMQISKAGADNLQRPVARVIMQVRKMSKMIEGFLDLARFESAKIQLNREIFDLAGLCTELELEFADQIGTHIIKFSGKESVMVFADRDKIAQVINNLVGNAAKYSPNGSTILMSCVRKKNIAMVSIQDQGIGVEGNEQVKLFERYYRGENNGTIAGFGIGLYLSAEIINRHNGKIWVESEAGNGSTFWFTVPLAN